MYVLISIGENHRGGGGIPGFLCIKPRIMRVNVARENGADTKVHINSVTSVSKKFNEVCGVFSSAVQLILSVSTIFMFLMHR